MQKHNNESLKNYWYIVFVNVLFLLAMILQLACNGSIHRSKAKP